MSKYNLTFKAIEDLSGIWNYTFEYWSENQADFYYQMLIGSCDEISENPNIGKNYKGIINKLFGLRVGKHIIFYKKTKDNEVEIIRILHEQMDLKNRINNPT